MRRRQLRIRRWLALAATLATLSFASSASAMMITDNGGGNAVVSVALGAPAVQAATRPDDRAGTLGIGTQQVTTDESDVISRYLTNHPAALRPDDRAGPLGVGTQQVTTDESDVISRYLTNHPAAVRPDDRAGPLGVGTQQVTTDESDVISRYLANHPATVRPDDRAGIRGVGTDAAGIVTSAGARSEPTWGTVALAAGAGALGAFAVALGGFALVRSRRSATAALQS